MTYKQRIGWFAVSGVLLVLLVAGIWLALLDYAGDDKAEKYLHSKKQQARVFAEKAQITEKECLQEWGILTKNPQKSCRAFTGFLSEPHRSLHITAKPKEPLLLQEVMALGQSTDFKQAAERIHLEMR